MKHFQDECDMSTSDETIVDYEFNLMSHWKEDKKDDYDDYGSLLFRHWITDLDEYDKTKYDEGIRHFQE